MPSSGSGNRDRKPVLDADDKEKWRYADHTRAKHRALRYYMVQWSRIVSDSRFPLRVFDFFAGRGEYYEPNSDIDSIPLKEIEAPDEVEYPGSPLIMLDVLSEHLNQHDVDFRHAEAYFMEPNDENRRILKSNLEKLEGVPDKVTPKVIDGKFHTDARDLIHQSNAMGNFALLFMDPYGLKALDYDTVTELTRVDRFDSIINLNTKNLVRWKDSPKHQETFRTLYGNEDWREGLKSTNPDNRYRAETEYYKERLKENGPEYVVSYLIHEEGKAGVMYNIVFTSNSKKGLKAAKEAISRVGTKYTMAHAPEDSEIHGDEQRKLGMMTEDEATAQYILAKFGGRSMAFDELKTELMVTQEDDPKIGKDYRRIIKKMHDEGQINIPERVPDGPLRDNFVVDVPEVDD